MTPITSATMPELALHELRRAIVAGELRPGRRVGQDEIAERLGLSVAPVREALRVLEQEGLVTYRPRRGYFVTELRVADLDEIYGLRRVLEERTVRRSLPLLDDDALERITLAARDCSDAAAGGNLASALEANRRFHFAIFDSPDQPHTMRLIRLLWESTEAYRALYYNAPDEPARTADAHARIVEAIRTGTVDDVVAELDAHRARALAVLRRILSTD